MEHRAEWNATVFSAPNSDGHVTVDYDSRVFRLGITFHGRKSSERSYKGRGWKAQLEHDACLMLEHMIYGETPAAEEKK